MDLKISFKSQLYALRELLLISIVYFSLMCYLYFNTEFSLFKILFLSTLLLYFLIFALPVIILHTNYIKNSKYKIVTIEKNLLKIDENTYGINDISYIEIFATKQHFDDSAGVTALPYNDYYYYIQMTITNGERVYLTSLLNYNLDKIIKNNFKNIVIKETPSHFALLLI